MDLEYVETVLEEFEHSLKREFYKGTVRTFNAVRLLTSKYITKFRETPSEYLIYERCLKLRRYWQEVKSPHPPILIIPPLMVTPQIYDLRPGHSFVRYLLDYEFDVFLIDFGAPTVQDRHLRLEDYVKNIERCVEVVRATSGAPRITLLGYCMGGIFCNMFAALDRLNRVESIIAIATPCDFTRIPVYHELAKKLERPLTTLAELLQGVPPMLSRTVFRMLQPVKNFLLPFNFILNLWDEEYVASYESMERWFEDFVAYPRDAFKQFFSEVVVKNKLFLSKLKLGGRYVDLSKISVPYLAIAGREDIIGHPDSVGAVLEAVGSVDKSFVLVRGGHLGVLVGKHARHGWAKITCWLKEHSAAGSFAGSGKKVLTKTEVFVKSSIASPRIPQRLFNISSDDWVAKRRKRASPAFRG
ncbi:MAG: alpha/beta fold hydrolase [Acidobacteriota bacterium]|nr:alpha/beta fold hydrolase [Blastocatellia bacterium]MDW8412275.1 alpha/beta fold hydrolase [Acidobacteriota bacterium]